MVRYTYGNYGKWECLFPKMDQNQSCDKQKIDQEWVRYKTNYSKKTTYPMKLVVS